ncbi:hypothetical protein NA57DRAFT_75853 [Rhizodiscina lignyota]|uniref:Uncharacterized protein n=1 Tax=Rhizodiscina lignyota TaxID=1504668 RepID=A0A9P4IBP1_9PEZI|nr:hypothetical protein NA57DRAFT_75853 [Rhizodiscina lignyota]
MAYNQSYGYGGPASYQQGVPAAGGYGAQQPASSTPTPPAPYGNPAYPANPQWPNPPPPQPTLQTNNQNPYQFHVPPAAPPPSQTQPGPNYMNYNPQAYGAIPGSPVGQARPPALPPRTNLAHKPSVSGSNRYNFTPTGPSWQQSNSPLVWNEAAGRYEHAPATGSQQQSTASGRYTPPSLPPRPGSSHAPPPAPMSPQRQAFLQNQAYLQQHSPDPQSPPFHPPGQTPGYSPSGTSSSAQQNNMPANTSQRPSSASPPPSRPPYAPKPYAPQQTQGPQSPPSHHQFQPSGFNSMFPVYQPPVQAKPPGTPPVTSTPPPPMPPRPSATPTKVSSPPPNEDVPVSPMEHRDSMSSLYEPPPPKGHGRGQKAPAPYPLVSRENSESSGPVVNAAVAMPQLPHPPVGPQQPPQKFRGPAKADSGDSGKHRFSVFAGGGGPSDWEHFGPTSQDSIDDTELYARKDAIKRHEQEIEIMELDSTPIPPPQRSGSAPPRQQSTEGGRPVGTLPPPPAPIPDMQVIKRTESPEPMEQPLRIAAKQDTESKAQPSTQPPAHHPPSSQPLDIAPALDPWYKNSLMRYIAMLYKEAGAAQVEEKHKIFTEFMMEEASIRGINIPLRAGSVSGYTPVLEYLHSAGAEKPKDSVLEKTEANKEQKEKGDAVPAKVDTNIVIVPAQEDHQEPQYSPGGRPIVGRPRQTTLTRPDANRSRTPSPKPALGASNAASPPAKAVESQAAAGSERRESAPGRPLQPVYTPFRAGGNLDRGNNIPDASAGASQLPPNPGTQPAYQSVYKPYVPLTAGFQPSAAATGTRKPSIPSSTAETTRTVQEIPPPAPQPAAPLPEKTKAADKSPEPPEVKPEVRQPAPKEPPLDNVVPPLPVQPPSLERLKELLPKPNASPILNPRLENLKTSLMLYPSNFDFVTVAFDKWKTKAASNRARAEVESRQRGLESQQQIDDLFNENQIAYSDIAMLEDSFKKQEAEIKSEQNEKEYESYLTDVFDPLYKRLQEEISVVTGLLRDAETMAREDGVAGKELLMLSNSNSGNGAADKVDLAEVLRLVVELHQKLEERHEQLVDCIVKRDRRRRAIDEVSVAGADKLNQVEFRKRLDMVEKNATVTKCEECKSRLQPLWQLVRPLTVRGARENKATVEEITKETEAASEQLANPENQHLKASITQALETLAASSKSLTGSFYAIDTNLNLAEFNSAVARATFDNAPRHVVTRLADEKGAEDVRLKEEHEARLAEIQTALKTAEETVEKAFRGKEGQAEHERRVKAALDDAKRRNNKLRSQLDVQTPIEPPSRGTRRF